MIITSTPLFQGLPKEDHEELATVVENRIFNQGELIFSEGDEGIAFVKLIQKNPSIALNMLSILSRRLRRFTSMIENLSLKEVPGRLAAYLLYLSESHQGADKLTLDISKGQLSNLLGTIPETLSRILTKMNKAGLVKTEGRHGISILDREGLEELASGERRLN